MTRRSLSASTALVLLVLCALSMTLVIIGYALWQAWQREDSALRQRMFTVVSAYAAQQKALTISTEVLLNTLALTPVVREGGEERLGEYMRRLDVSLPDYLGFAIFDGQGRTRASVSGGKDFPSLPPEQVRERSYFQMSWQTRSFSVGGSLMTRGLPPRIFLPMALPILGFHDRVEGIIMAPLDMSRYDRGLGEDIKTFLRDNTMHIRLLDARGRVMYQAPHEFAPHTGEIMESTCFEEAWHSERNIFEHGHGGAAGHKVVCLVIKLRTAPNQEPYMYILLETPELTWQSFVAQRYVHEMLAFGVSFIIALALAFFVGRRYFSKGLHNLVTVARKARAGDMNARNGNLQGCREIQLLGADMDTMLDAIRQGNELSKRVEAMEREQAEYYRKLSTQDGLTGLVNRRRFDELALAEMERCLRYGHALSLMMTDIDHFKNVNDTYGHAAGDEVLRVFAKTMQSLVRSTDVVARYGGEEFVLILPETSLIHACAMAEKIREACAALCVRYGDMDIRFTASFGLCTQEVFADGVKSMPAEDCVQQLLTRTDAALYISKEQGRNRVTACGASV